MIVAITRDSGGLWAQREGLPGAARLQIFPEAPLAFFWKAVDAQIEFTTDRDGAVIGAGLKQNGAPRTGKRITP